MEIESSFVYLVFYHALRIRINGNSENTKEDSPTDKKVDSDSASVASTSSNTVPDDEAQEDAIATGPSKGGKAVEQQTRHLVGKINNLITSDVLGMAQAWDVVSLRTYPVRFRARCLISNSFYTVAASIQLAIALVILYKLVGWRSVSTFD